MKSWKVQEFRRETAGAREGWREGGEGGELGGFRRSERGKGE